MALAHAARAGPLLSCKGKGKGTQALRHQASQGFVVKVGS
jgi:hypothetical protein